MSKSFEEIAAKFNDPGVPTNDVWRELQGYWAAQGCTSEIAFCQARIEGKSLGESVDACYRDLQRGPGMTAVIDVPPI